MQKMALGSALLLSITALYFFKRKSESAETAEKTATTAQPVSAIKSPITFIQELVSMSQQPRGIRNNNPLNIRKSSDNWQGKTGDDGAFVIFDTPYSGIRAAARLLKNYGNNYGLVTVRGIINRWAPSSENNTESYITSVEKSTGLFRDLTLNGGDYPSLVAAMIKHENGQQPYGKALIAQAVSDGFK